MYQSISFKTLASFFIVFLVGNFYLHGAVKSFILAGDTQLTSKNGINVKQKQIDTITRFANLLNNWEGMDIPFPGKDKTLTPEGLVIAGDLVNALCYDPRKEGVWEKAQVEWDLFTKIFGASGAGGDGLLKIPVYETWGNHDAPSADDVTAINSFVQNEMIYRTINRPDVVNISSNGLHYSWDWEGVHFVCIGVYGGLLDLRKGKARFASRKSLVFLEEDLKEHIGDSGRPVFIIQHIPVNYTATQWPKADKDAYEAILANYNIAGICNGHTHWVPPSHRYWNGGTSYTDVPINGSIDFPSSGSYNSFDVSNIAVGRNQHGFFYGEIHNSSGTKNDKIVVYAIYTKDNWQTIEWKGLQGTPANARGGVPVNAKGHRKDFWEIQVTIPDDIAQNSK